MKAKDRMEFPGRPGGLGLRRIMSGSRLWPSMTWPVASLNRVGTPNEIDFAAHALPACALVNAPVDSRWPAHDSGSEWFATRSL
jgi:hypothetical protein